LHALLDTCLLIDLERTELGVYEDAVLVASAISVGELAFGVDMGSDPDVRQIRLRKVLASMEIIPFGVEEAKLYGVLATLVRAVGRNPRPRRLDLQIAATAAATRVPLLTHNADDFRGIDRLVDVVPVKRLA
jgi:predicted nucleic acid-binding protein